MSIHNSCVCCFPALPQAPTVSCSPTGYVPENSTLSCTCNTATLGQPTGRLRWFWGTGNNINNNINDGNYGDTSLQMEPQKLVRGDDNRKKFRCDAEWATTVGGQVYTARVGCESIKMSPNVFAVCSQLSFFFFLLAFISNSSMHKTPKDFAFTFIFLVGDCCAQQSSAADFCCFSKSNC